MPSSSVYSVAADQPATANPPRRARHTPRGIHTALLVETLPLYREALTGILHSTLQMDVCAVLADLTTAAALIRDRRPQVIVLDRDAPGADLAAVISVARATRPDARVVVTTSACPASPCAGLAADGIDLCLSKRLPLDTLRHLLQRLVLPAQADDAEPPAPDAADATVLPEATDIHLTESERRVLALIALGHTVRETAAALGRSPKTIDAHKTRIMGKLGIHDRVVLARYAIRAGIVSA